MASDSGYLSAPTAWDRKLIALLSPIASRAPKLRFHFFANTFPLAYHYWWALREAGKRPEDSLEFATGFNPPRAREWGYATLETARRNRRECVPVTRFKPRFVFAERTLWTWHVQQLLRNREVRITLRSFIEEVKRVSPSLNLVLIYAELSDLGRIVQKYVNALVGDTGLDVKVFSVAHSGSLFLAPPVPVAHREPFRTVLRLFVYGGPLSTYLQRKDNRYLPLALDEGFSADADPTMEVALVLDKGATDDDKQCLARYHKELLRAASAGSCAAFSSVYRAFNEMAWLVQSRASFQSADEFRECVKAHHAAPSAK